MKTHTSKHLFSSSPCPWVCLSGVLTLALGCSDAIGDKCVSQSVRQWNCFHTCLLLWSDMLVFKINVLFLYSCMSSVMPATKPIISCLIRFRQVFTSCKEPFVNVFKKQWESLEIRGFQCAVFKDICLFLRVVDFSFPCLAGELNQIVRSACVTSYIVVLWCDLNNTWTYIHAYLAWHLLSLCRVLTMPELLDSYGLLTEATYYSVQS